VQIEYVERVGGIVLVENRFGAREEMILRVERGLDRVICLLLPVLDAVVLRLSAANEMMSPAIKGILIRIPCSSLISTPYPQRKTAARNLLCARSARED
jgi:hypothetical protein